MSIPSAPAIHYQVIDSRSTGRPSPSHPFAAHSVSPTSDFSPEALDKEQRFLVNNSLWVYLDGNANGKILQVIQTKWGGRVSTFTWDGVLHDSTPTVTDLSDFLQSLRAESGTISQDTKVNHLMVPGSAVEDKIYQRALQIKVTIDQHCDGFLETNLTGWQEAIVSHGTSKKCSLYCPGSSSSPKTRATPSGDGTNIAVGQTDAALDLSCVERSFGSAPWIPAMDASIEKFGGAGRFRGYIAPSEPDKGAEGDKGYVEITPEELQMPGTAGVQARKEDLHSTDSNSVGV